MINGILKKIALVDLIGLSVVSLILQFNDSFILIILQRFVLCFTFGYLMIGFKVLITEVANPLHRGKILFGFLNISIVGVLIYRYWYGSFEINIAELDITYAHLQIPYFILPLLILLVIKYLPGSRINESRNALTFSYFFKPIRKKLLLAMIVLAILLSFANSQLFFLMLLQKSIDVQRNYIDTISLAIWLVAAITGVLSIDYFGRKGLLQFGMIALMIFAAIIIVVSLVANSPMVVWVSICLYYFLSIYTITTTATIIILEYLPNAIRGRGMILFALICWVPNTINNAAIYPSIFDSEYLVYIVSITSLVVLITSYFLFENRLVETKKMSLDKIETAIIDQWDSEK
ncbi:MFS transporter [Carboxylicivirga marina]|uniref:MFS transporter n=1 Tax=Carboxylicivirga marina TaxID=2800988 RepID=A0ABS1HN00_9BACT|nr:MFS transporter [Carboxylicivirga marina]MBK3518653.1 MFS transporter [Carboxylicivirga marina]